MFLFHISFSRYFFLHTLPLKVNVNTQEEGFIFCLKSLYFYFGHFIRNFEAQNLPLVERHIFQISSNVKNSQPNEHGGHILLSNLAKLKFCQNHGTWLS